MGCELRELLPSFVEGLIDSNINCLSMQRMQALFRDLQFLKAFQHFMHPGGGNTKARFFCGCQPAMCIAHHSAGAHASSGTQISASKMSFFFGATRPCCEVSISRHVLSGTRFLEVKYFLQIHIWYMIYVYSRIEMNRNYFACIFCLCIFGLSFVLWIFRSTWNSSNTKADTSLKIGPLQRGRAQCFGVVLLNFPKQVYLKGFSLKDKKVALGVFLHVFRHERFVFLFIHLFMSLVLCSCSLVMPEEKTICSPNQFHKREMFRRKPIDGAPEPCEIVDFVRARLQEKQPLEAS